MSASLGAAEHAGPRETVRANIPMLQAQASMLMPGMRHARTLLDTAICVLEYFEGHAAADARDGAGASEFRADPLLTGAVDRMVAMLSAFRRLA